MSSEKLPAVIFAISVAFAGCSSGGQTPYTNLISMAVRSAADKNFEDMRGQKVATMTYARTMYDARMLGNSSPTFDRCRLIFGSNERWLDCQRFGNAAVEPGATRLQKFIAASLPRSYRQQGCRPFDRLMAYCKKWTSVESSAPSIILLALEGDGGKYIYTLEVRKLLR